ncbi:MAG: hypothetical protein QOE00_2527 [Ilumatobacteraceae bacterium]
MRRVDDQIDFRQQSERRGEPAVGEVVPNLATLTSRTHQTTTAKARQMVGDVGPTLPQLARQIGRVCGPIEQPNENATTHSIGHSRTHATECVKPQIREELSRHLTTVVQPLL